MDYDEVEETFTLGGCQLTYAVNISISMDERIENTEIFSINIVSPDPLPARVTLDPDVGSVFITDDTDGKPHVIYIDYVMY